MRAAAGDGGGGRRHAALRGVLQHDHGRQILAADVRGSVVDRVLVPRSVRRQHRRATQRSHTAPMQGRQHMARRQASACLMHAVQDGAARARALRGTAGQPDVGIVLWHTPPCCIRAVLTSVLCVTGSENSDSCNRLCASRNCGTGTRTQYSVYGDLVSECFCSTPSNCPPLCRANSHRVGSVGCSVRYNSGLSLQCCPCVAPMPYQCRLVSQVDDPACKCACDRGYESINSGDSANPPVCTEIRPVPPPPPETVNVTVMAPPPPVQTSFPCR